MNIRNRIALRAYTIARPVPLFSGIGRLGISLEIKWLEFRGGSRWADGMFQPFPDGTKRFNGEAAKDREQGDDGSLWLFS
jgi:hypothetical protein